MVSPATESAEYIESAAHFSWSETGYVGFDIEFSDVEEHFGVTGQDSVFVPGQRSTD